MRATLAVVALTVCQITAAQSNPLIERIHQFEADLGSVSRAYPVSQSENSARRLRAFYESERKSLREVDFDRLSQEAKIDYLLLSDMCASEVAELDSERKRLEEIAPLLTFAKTLTDLEESRRKMEPLDPAKAADTLNKLKKDVEKLSGQAAALAKGQNQPENPALSKLLASPKDHKTRVLGRRAAQTLDGLIRHFDNWFRFYDGYDPMFTWWCAEPQKSARAALAEYSKVLKEQVLGLKPDDKTTIIGDPIGREALLDQLKRARVPYTPEELIAIAGREYAWCLAEMRKASKALGFDNWHDAIEHVKKLHVAPGEQPKIIREMALEAIDFVEKHNLVTVPQIAKETWRMEMLSPEAQLQSPFFLGGEAILVSFPTDDMPHEAKLMSLRGNNIHFSRAVVHHELIPGHHLQLFMLQRHRPHRQMFGTPFWTEGWALYWEMLLWDLGFPATPEQKIGMLFWRMHRCVRIQFSLGFHLGQLTPEQCVKMLIENVGHEPDNASAEVRRSFSGGYGPLYQIAYMIGGLQFRSLHKELVGSGKMTNRQFHDAILRNGPIPVEMVRAALANVPLRRDYPSQWRFDGR